MQLSSHTGPGSRAKFIPGGILIPAAVVCLIFSPDTHNLFIDITNMPGGNATIATQGGLARI